MQVSLEQKSSTCQHLQQQVGPPQLLSLLRELLPLSLHLLTCSCLSKPARYFLARLRPPAGPVSVRCHPAPEAPSNSIGLEAIIRKALMGNYDDQSEERPPTTQATVAGVSAGPEDFFSQGALTALPVLSWTSTASRCIF